VIDPRILQHALIHEGERRKLLVLLANGNLAAREAHPDDPMMREFARETGALKVRASAQPDAGSVASWRARLPDGAPDDIVLIGTRPLFDLGFGPDCGSA
jgi:hypothetical protein